MLRYERYFIISKNKLKRKMSNCLSPILTFLASYFSVFAKAKPYSLYVLALLYVAYMLNQLDRYTLSITSIETAQELKYGDKQCFKLDNLTKEEGNVCNNLNETACVAQKVNNSDSLACKYDYNGQGIEYQVVAGPIFILVFTFTGIFLSIVSDNLKNKRVIILTVCLVWWSVMTILTGFVNEFWQLVVLRLGLGFGQAGCNPLATSLIADYFSAELRGSAISVYNWGIYTGYSLSFAIGNQILKHLNWRWVFFISGIPGIFLAVLMFFSVREPKSEQATSSQQEVTPQSADEPYLSKLFFEVIYIVI